MRLTVGQAVVRFLAAQYSERDGRRQRFIPGCFGIFGHGNVAGLGQGLLEAELDRPGSLPYYQGRNEQAMVHAAVGFARARLRLATLACTTSVGPGATNMVTGAALATINRLPVLLLPSDVFATRRATPVLQELEAPDAGDVSVNDTFRPVSRYFDRVQRPEQLPSALLNAMRVLTDPAQTGAVTVCLPQDVQTEAWNYPDELFVPRVWAVPRPAPDPELLDRLADLIRAAKRPLIIAGGGVVYSEATAALRTLVDATGIPVAETQAGKGCLPFDHPDALGAVGATGTAAAVEVAAAADLVIGVGTRWTDFTSASRSAFQHRDVRFVNINVAASDASKQGGLAVLADARLALSALVPRLAGYRSPSDHRALRDRWQASVTASGQGRAGQRPSQAEVIGAVSASMASGDLVVGAAGSLPGDLHRLWPAREPAGYHVEYGYSCMGYEIAGGLGAKMAAPDREVVVLVGDGSYLMMAQELVTSIQEGLKLIVVLVQNHGFASIGSLSRSIGSLGFGTEYRYRSGPVADGGRLDGDLLPVDLAANAASLGALVLRADTIDALTAALARARSTDRTTVIHVETDPTLPAPDGGGWWDVPVAETATLASTNQARRSYAEQVPRQRPLLGPPAWTERLPG